MFHKNAIAENFNQYFVDVSQMFSIIYEKYKKNSMSEFNISDQEFREDFFSLKINKSSGYDTISFNK